MPADGVCPNCGIAGAKVFYSARGIPVHSVQLLRTRREALDYPRGDVDLAFCRSCGFICNATFDASLHDYSHDYESTQQFSPTFNAFHKQLAERLVERYGLHGKEVVEIGCGQGEFLALLCEAGGNRGTGFDPAFVDGRNAAIDGSRIKVVKDYFSERYSDCRGDFYCCKMTLEHIPDTMDFVATVRRAIGDRPDAVVFFQVPDVGRILRDVAFWDIYYEHCSYFSIPSLAHLFRASGFRVLGLNAEYDDQYLMIEARPAAGAAGPLPAIARTSEDVARDVAYFAANCRQKVDGWRRTLADLRRAGRRAVIWGAGSKGVAFLTTLGVHDEIQFAVDVNPLKHGTFLAGSGQEVIAPHVLRDYRPDAVIVMNPIYGPEIRQQLDGMGIAAQMMTPQADGTQSR